MELSQLNQKCLANMPMLLDAISETCENLAKVLKPYCDDFEDALTSTGFKVDERREAEWNMFGDVDDFRRRQLKEVSAFSNWRNRIYVHIKRHIFLAEYGYYANDERSAVYFQIIELTENRYFTNKPNVLDEDYIDSICDIKTNFSKLKVDTEGRNDLLVEVDGKKIVTDKIEEALKVFKKVVLTNLAKTIG